jgi:predicted small lipoprotein YifL
MRLFALASLVVFSSLALVGCGSSGPVKPPPARMASGLFKNTDLSTVKNNLMSVCSKSRLRIQTDKNEITCTSPEIDPQRNAMITAMINNEWALQYKDVVGFTLSTEGSDVRVTANSYLEFVMPKGLMADAPARSTRNLLDDASFINAQQLLKAAGASD